MTRYLGEDGKVHIMWDGPDEPVGYTTPDSSWHAHEFCGNCGWDAPGCGCPRDDYYDGDRSVLTTQQHTDPPIPISERRKAAEA